LAVQLRRYGFDTVSSQEASMLLHDDERQFAWAKYIEEGKEHYGIILSTAETVAVLLHRLLRLLTQYRQMN